MIQVDHKIQKLLSNGDVVIDGGEPLVGPSSIDLTLADEFSIYHPGDVQYSEDCGCMEHLDEVKVIDPRVEERMTEVVVNDYLDIQPLEFALARTREHVELPEWITARVEGRSSYGRMGLFVHITAGYIDPGFKGTITLELFNANNRPIRLYVGARICQLVLHKHDACEKPYCGKYQNQKDVTPTRISNELQEYGSSTLADDEQ